MVIRYENDGNIQLPFSELVQLLQPLPLDFDSVVDLLQVAVLLPLRQLELRLHEEYLPVHHRRCCSLILLKDSLLLRELLELHKLGWLVHSYHVLLCWLVWGTHQQGLLQH